MSTVERRIAFLKDGESVKSPAHSDRRLFGPSKVYFETFRPSGQIRAMEEDVTSEELESAEDSDYFFEIVLLDEGTAEVQKSTFDRDEAEDLRASYEEQGADNDPRLRVVLWEWKIKKS